MKVLYFGNEYSHTYAAASAMHFGDGLGVRFAGGDNITALLDELMRGEGDVCVVPIENSVEGTVTETLDGVYRKGLYFVQEEVLPICQNLVGLPGTTLADIKHVYSHPQALSQCRSFLNSKLSRAKQIPVSYTSAGMRQVTSAADACIARCADGRLTVLTEHIEDSKHNATRFVSVSRTPSKTGKKVSVAFSTPNKPGGLLSALTVFKDFSLNMTKIESRPDKHRLGDYIFYVDFVLDIDVSSDALQSGILSALDKKTDNLRFLGRYRPAENVT